MSVLEQHRYTEMVKRLFNQKPSLPVALTQAVSPTVDVQDAYRPEQRALRGERLWGCCLELTTALAATNDLILVNPGSSLRIAVISDVTVSLLVPTSTVQAVDSGAFFVSRPVAEGSVGAGVSGKDTRNLLTQSTQFTTRTGGTTNIQTKATNSVWGFKLPTETTARQLIVQKNDMEVVLFPGFTCDIGFYVSAFPTTAWLYLVSVEGFERPFEGGETTQVA